MPPASQQHQTSPDPYDLFWSLMARWRIPDREALALIGGIYNPALRRRLRFALVPEQIRRLALLLQIDEAAADHTVDVGHWIRCSSGSAFRGLSPVGYMICEGTVGMEDVLRHLGLMSNSGQHIAARATDAA